MHSLEGKTGAGESLLGRLEQRLLRPSAADTHLHLRETQGLAKLSAVISLSEK